MNKKIIINPLSVVAKKMQADNKILNAMKKSINRKSHSYHVDGLGTMGIVIGIASVGFIMYNVLHVIFS